METTDTGTSTDTSAVIPDQRCAYLADWNVQYADFVAEDVDGDGDKEEGEGACRIRQCADGWANATDANQAGTQCMSFTDQAADGCEISLWDQAAYAEPYIELPSVRGDAGWDSERAHQTYYYGYGSTDFLILLTEDDNPATIHDMNVRVSLLHHPDVKYQLEVWGPGECSDPKRRGGLRQSGFSGGGCSGGFTHNNVDLTWPERRGLNDWAYVWIRVTYLGGGALGDGYYSLFVGSTDYYQSIDYVPRNASDIQAQPSLACVLP